MYWSSDSGHRQAVVQPPLSQCIRISEIPESEEVLGGPDAPEPAPAPRLEARIPLVVMNSLPRRLHVNLLDSTIDALLFKRPDSLDQYSAR